MRHRTWLMALLGVLALLAAACSGGDGDAAESEAGGTATEAAEPASEESEAAAEEVTEPIAVGSTNFTEQELVAEMYAVSLTDAGYEVERRFQLGAREVVLPALQNGDIDVYPEYVGTFLEFLSGGAGVATADTQESLQLLRDELAEERIVVLEPAEAQDKNALVVTQETADELGLTTVSDLEGQAGELTLGGPPECPQRPLCLPGYEDTYGLEFGDFASLDAGGPLTIEALENGDIDVALMFTTQGIIDERGWVTLEDDQGLQPAENVVPAVREEIATDGVTEALNQVSSVLTTEALTQLNRQVDVDGEPIPEVAQTFLEEEGVLGG